LDIEGEVRFHHLLPDLRVLEARSCAHRWVVFHETYDFCLITRQPAKRVDWKYNHRLYTVDDDHVIMAMQPGELHANIERTSAGDFIVVQVAEKLMLHVARQLGWRSSGLNLSHPHPASTDPALRRALELVRSGLCSSLWTDPKRSCRCASCPALHAEHLVELVRAFILGCADGSAAASVPDAAPALVLRAREYLLENRGEPYDLETFARQCGVSEPFYLLHAFKQAFQVCPSEFRRRVLVARTCEALAREPRRGLELIASDVGWVGQGEGARKSDMLIRHFRRTLGLTPDRFRQVLKTLTPSDWRRRANEALESALRTPGGTH